MHISLTFSVIIFVSTVLIMFSPFLRPLLPAAHLFYFCSGLSKRKCFFNSVKVLSFSLDFISGNAFIKR